MTQLKTPPVPDSSAAVPTKVDFLVIGGGVAGAIGAETLRAEGGQGSITILSSETTRPYHNPPLSKQMLVRPEDEERIFVHPPEFYAENAITLELGTRVTAIDTVARTAATADGRRFAYGKLLLATGGTPRRLPVPGADLPGVMSLRHKADAEAINAAAGRAGAGGRAVVLGGSFLGMEIAMSLVELGLDVTVIERGPVLLTHLENAELSLYFRRWAEKIGTRIILDDTAVAFRGDGHVETVVTEKGLEVPCDLVVVSIGVLPSTGFLDGSGVTLERGYIAVDDRMRTSAPDVFAAGDVTTFYDSIFARRRHIEHWDNAVKQARVAARNMRGRRVRFDEVSLFFCEVGDLGFNVVGATEEADEWIMRGSFEDEAFALYYLKDDVPRAVFAIGLPADEIRLAENLIRNRVNLAGAKERLSEPGFLAENVHTQTALILQGGGALGAFECGVVQALEEAGIFPDVVAGVSIGALNGAVIASNPRQASAALDAFWRDLAVVTPAFLPPQLRRQMGRAQVLGMGVPNFFRSRMMTPFGFGEQATSYYDTTPMRELITRYVDFAGLKTSPTRLLVSAVNVETAELEIFDSYVDDLTPDHLLASGSLPPGFPWTMIDGKAYWDGGIISNSPLDLLVERCGPDGKRVFIVDLFAGHRDLPTNMMEVMARRSEIVYSERVRNDLRHREIVGGYRRLVEQMLANVPAAEHARLKRLPGYIQLMGDNAETSITRIVRQGSRNEHSSRDYDFSDLAIQANIAEGRAVALAALAPANRAE